MDFLTATTYDILKISRESDFNDILKAFDTLEYHGEELDDFPENKTVALLLAGEELSLDDVEYFANYQNNNNKGSVLYTSNKDFNQDCEDISGLDYDEELIYSEHKNRQFEKGNIHRLQYEKYVSRSMGKGLIDRIYFFF